jgi:hypothetical protein
MNQKYPTKNKPADVQATADDLAVAILQDRIEDAAHRRRMAEQPAYQLTAHDLARLGQQGALN